MVDFQCLSLYPWPVRHSLAVEPFAEVCQHSLFPAVMQHGYIQLRLDNDVITQVMAGEDHDGDSRT